MNADRFFEYILFPGITVHELAHIFACIILGVKIKSVKILSFKEGYVVHESSRNYKNIIVAIMPFFFNILLAIGFAFLIKSQISIYLKIFLIWIAVSSLFFSVPSKQDANNVFVAIKKSYTRKQNVLIWLIKIILIPITLLILILSWLFKILDQSLIFRVILIAFWVYVFFI